MPTIRLRRGSTALWADVDPVLAAGEPGVELGSDPLVFKVGDGITKWSLLPTLGGAAAAVTKASLGLDNVDNTSDANKPVSTAQAAAIAGVTKGSIGLGNVDNTSDANKPVSTAQAAAIAGVTKASLGLGNVDNTSDANKPVSTAQAAAIAANGKVVTFPTGSEPALTGVSDGTLWVEYTP